MDASIAAEMTDEKMSAKRIAQDFLMAGSLGESSKADALLEILSQRQTVDGKLDTDFYSIYSNAAAYDLLVRADALTTADFDIDAVVDYLMSEQDTNGAFPVEDSINWISNDFMVTAQSVRVLNALKAATSVDANAVEAAIADGMDWLKSNQQADGSYIFGFFDDPVVDTAEMVCTAVALGEDPSLYISDEGNSPLDYFRESALVDGSYGNVASTTWAMDALMQMEISVPGGATLDLEISPVTVSINTGSSKQLTLTAMKLDGTSGTIFSSATWTTDDESVASVDTNGLVTGESEGTTTVTGEYASIAVSADVTVDPVLHRMTAMMSRCMLRSSAKTEKCCTDRMM